MVDLSSWMAVLPQVVTALILILLGLWLARRVEHVLANLLDQHQVLDLTFRGVLTALARYSILLLALIAALQGTLSNLAAGVMLLWLRPFRVGDAIETASVAGTIMDVGLFATEIRRPDGVYVFTPNTDLWSKPLANLSRMPSRLIDLKVTIKKGSDIQAARDLLLAAAAAEEVIHKIPAPTVVVSAVTESGIVLSLNAWVDTSHFRQASHELAERASTSLANL